MTLEAAITYLATKDDEFNDGEIFFKLTENNLKKIWKKYKDYPDFQEDFYLLPHE